MSAIADPDSIKEFNESVIAEFRANGGRVDGRLAGTPILLLHRVGVRRERARMPAAFGPASGSSREASRVRSTGCVEAKTRPVLGLSNEARSVDR